MFVFYGKSMETSLVFVPNPADKTPQAIICCYKGDVFGALCEIFSSGCRREDVAASHPKSQLCDLGYGGKLETGEGQVEGDVHERRCCLPRPSWKEPAGVGEREGEEPIRTADSRCSQ